MTVMTGYHNHKICFITFLLLMVSSGCSDPDKSGNNLTLTPPTVASVAPAAGAVGVCSSTVVTATFSTAMNPSSLTTTTFTLTGPGTTPVAGAVTYAASTATFIPSSPLALSTLYTATITTGAKSSYGVAL